MPHTEPRCFVHIGAPKTGSTLIQRFCDDQREALLGYGVLYPSAGLRAHGHHDLAFLLAGEYPEWATPQERPLAELAEELRRAAAGHDGSLLLSSENFYLFGQPERLLELLETCAIAPARRPTVIVYLRRQDEAHASWYNQRVKAQGYTGDIDACIQASWPLWDYAAQLERWARVFGPENLVVRLYDRGPRDGGDLAGDFLDAIGLEHAEVALPTGRANTGLNKSLLEFQRVMNGLPLRPQEQRRFHDALIELSARTAGSGLFDESPLLGPDRRRAIMDRYAEGNADVAARYFDRFRLFDREPADPHDTEVAAHDDAPLDVERLAAVVGWLLVRNAPERSTQPQPQREDTCAPATR